MVELFPSSQKAQGMSWYCEGSAARASVSALDSYIAAKESAHTYISIPYCMCMS